MYRVSFSLLLILLIASATSAVADATPVRSQSSAKLIEWLSEQRRPSDVDAEAVAKELRDRHEVKLLVDRLVKENDEQIRLGLVSSVLYQIEDEQISKCFLARLNEKEDAETYYMANYLAKQRNLPALAMLNRHYYKYPVSSAQWAYTVQAFGKARYYPAARNLVDSLNAASLNVGGAALDALRQMFPDSPKQFSGPQEARKYFLKRIKDRARAEAPDKGRRSP